MTREEKITSLAYDIVESWDMDTLISMAVEVVESNLSALPEPDFQEEWDNFYGEVEPDDGDSPFFEEPSKEAREPNQQN